MEEEDYNALPEEVKAILDTWQDEGDKYQQCDRVIAELEKIGWTADYGLCGEIDSVYPL